MSSPTPSPEEILRSVQRGDLQNVVKWLGNGGLVDALCSAPNTHGETSDFALLHGAAGCGHLEMVRELLQRGASVDLPSGLDSTALMSAAYYGSHSILLVLLQHSASVDQQDNNGGTALIKAAYQGQEACVQALLRAKAKTVSCSTIAAGMPCSTPSSRGTHSSWSSSGSTQRHCSLPPPRLPPHWTLASPR